MTAEFVHLRVHTEYSLVDGLVRIDRLMTQTASAGMPAVAMTDHVNLFGLVKFYQAAHKAGIKPIVGVDLLLDQGEGETPARFTLLCLNAEGYRNLTRLISRAYIEGQGRGRPLVQREWVAEAATGLLALSGAREGDIGRALLAGRSGLAEQHTSFWQQHFPERFYIELQRTGRPGEEDYLHAAVELAGRMDLPVVATNDVRFLAAGDFDAHEVRVCINSGRTLADPRRPRDYSPQQYLCPPAEMAERFADLPEALQNTVEIARRCTLDLKLGENYLPQFPVPEGMSTEDYLLAEAERGLEARFQAHLAEVAADAGQAARYRERLTHELAVINDMGFPGYFLIVAEFIRWAREQDIPVGPGRGSGAGSLVAYALGITDIDPLSYDLLFERFLNPERVSMPDFDIDFCMEKRDHVIAHVASLYGREKVSQIITFGTMAARAVVRDVGRVLGHPYGFVDRVAKLIPPDLGMTLEKALEDEELARVCREEEEVQALIDLARPLEGVARNAGKHAGGVVIAPSALTDFAPLYCEADGDSPVTQFDKDDVESVGLVKFDFLGLRTLTIIDWTVKAVNRMREASGEAPLDIGALAMDDPAVFKLLGRQETTAVFQLESTGMKELIKRLRPDTFEDIVALVALFRPGPLQSGMVDDFVNRKHGLARVVYPHPELESILRPTYGVILYQEQVMQIAQVLAGYTLGEADLLRRAMGKKKPEEMARQREIFMQGATGRGVDSDTATHIFDLMEKFAGYGFNKSHSAAYALLSYQTAWLKAHYPAQFMAAVLSSDMDNTDKVVTFIDNCSALGLSVLPPDVNASAWPFHADEASAIRYGLGAIKGVGQAAIEAIISEREANGPYEDLLDFCRRVDLRRVNRRVIDSLIRAGAMDSLEGNRATQVASLDTALRAAEQHMQAADTGQNDLFGLGGAREDAVAPAPGLSVVPEWSDRERLQAEKDTLGLYLTGHPIEEYEDELQHIVTGRIADLAQRVAGGVSEQGFGGGNRRVDVVIAGLVVAMRRQGGRAFLTLDDRSARVEMPLFDENFQRYRHLLIKDALLVVEGSLAPDDYTGGVRITPRAIHAMDDARESWVRKLVVLLENDGQGEDPVAELERVLAPWRGGNCRVGVVYRNLTAEARLMLGDEWKVKPSEELVRRLRRWLGADNVKLVYGRQANGDAVSP